MTDPQLLLVVLIAIYLSECCSWADTLTIVFHTRGGRRWRWSQPGEWFGNDSGGLVVRFPFPPLGHHFFVRFWPVSISEHGVVAYVSHAVGSQRRAPQSENVALFQTEFDDPHAREREIYVNHRPLIKASSHKEAKWLLDRLFELNQLPHEQRATRLEALAQAAFDVTAIGQRLREYYDAANPVITANCFLWFHLFVVSPLVASRKGFAATWWILLPTMFVLWLVATLMFRSSHRQLYPSHKSERRKALATISLNPLGTLRSHDLLGRELLASFHPIAVAYKLLAPSDFRAFARIVVRDLRYPLRPIEIGSSAEGAEIEAAYRTWQLQHIEQFLVANHVELAALYAAPHAEDVSSQSYCPRCETQFTLDQGVCENCGGIPLAGWPQPEGARGST